MVEVVKIGVLTRNNTLYDILKVADKALTDPAASQTHMMVKVFHNDGKDWPENGRPAMGQVLVFKDMTCKEYNGRLEGIVYSTNMVCVCTRDEDDHLVWHSHSKKCPHNIEDAEKVALQLFDWWAKDGSNFQFGRHGVQVSSRAAAVLPTCDISHAGGKGLFTLYCQVVKKTLFRTPGRSMAVLRVRDGTCTSYQFEEITYNPIVELDESQLVFGSVGSLEVDIMVKCSSMPPKLENLQVESFVQLRGVDCMLLPAGCRRLIFILDNDDEQVKVLGDDDPELQPLQNRVSQVLEEDEAAAMEYYDEISTMNCEEIDGGAGLTPQDSPAPCRVTPSPQPDLHTDSFEIFIRQNELPKLTPQDSPAPSIVAPGPQPDLHTDSEIFMRQDESPKKLPSDGDFPTSKRRRLNFSSSGMSIQAVFPFRPTLQPSISHPSPQPHASKCVPSSQLSPFRQDIHATSPQPSTSRQPPHPSSPHSPFSKQPLHPSSTKVPATRQSQQHTPPQVPTHASSSVSTHDSALEEVQQAGSADMPVPAALQTTTLKFHTEVVGEAKESSLETFYFQGKVGEVHRVEAAITDIRVIAGEDCWCRDADHACLHQWVWGLCDKCDSVFPSTHLAKSYSSLALNSLDILLCRSCMHERATHSSAQPMEGDGKEQPQGTAPQFLAAEVKPFIKIKVEVENLTSRFQLTLWLTADNANLFFGVKPSFKWIIKEEEKLQEMIGTLLEQNSSLTLGMMKKQVKGRIDLHIVKTVLHCTSLHSKIPPPKPPNLQPASPLNPATSPLPQAPCPEPSRISPPNPKPTDPPDCQQTSPPHT